METSRLYDSYSALVRRHERLIGILCLRYGGKADSPDDLAQEVRIGLWQHFCAMQRELPHWKESLWVYWYTRSILSHRLRHTSIELVRLNNVMLDTIAEHSGDDYALLDELAEGLDDSSRRLLDLMLQGYGSDEIAQLEGISMEALRARRHRLVDQLRRRAADLGLHDIK